MRFTIIYTNEKTDTQGTEEYEALSEALAAMFDHHRAGAQTSCIDNDTGRVRTPMGLNALAAYAATL